MQASKLERYRHSRAIVLRRIVTIYTSVIAFATHDIIRLLSRLRRGVEGRTGPTERGRINNRGKARVCVPVCQCAHSSPPVAPDDKLRPITVLCRPKPSSLRRVRRGQPASRGPPFPAGRAGERTQIRGKVLPRLCTICMARTSHLMLLRWRCMRTYHASRISVPAGILGPPLAFLAFRIHPRQEI